MRLFPFATMLCDCMMCVCVCVCVLLPCLQHDNGTALNPIHALGGKLNLRGLQQEVAALRETLSHYRPNVVVGDARDGEGDADKREHSDTNTHVNEDGNADVNI